MRLAVRTNIVRPLEEGSEVVRPRRSKRYRNRLNLQ